MADNKMIHEFAILWFRKFIDKKSTGCNLAGDSAFADACLSFDFKMDCGEAFITAYSSETFNDYRELDKIIECVVNIPLLGSAIFSRWRYFNHSADNPNEIAEADNRAWFIIALSRLERLAANSDESPFIFQGKAKKIKIISNCLCYGQKPQPNDEVEQRLSITEDGRVFFSSYNYCDGDKYTKAKTRNFKVETEVAKNMFELVGDYFSDEFDVPYVTDVGDWKLFITNTDDVTFNFTGSLCSMIPALENVSSAIRAELNMPELLVFDGASHEDRIEKIVIDYHRVTKVKPIVPFNPEIEYATWDYSEHIIIDRASESLEHIQNIGSGCKVSRIYHVEDGLSAFLDDHYSSDLFSSIKGNPPDVIDDPLELRDYTITVDYLYGGQHVISGSFDKNGLPEDFPELAEDIMEFMCFYGMGEILNPSVYRKAKRKNSDYIFCSVEFGEGSKSYYYLTEDNSLSIGDFVFVPVGKNGHTAIVKVVNIEYFPEDKVPFPLDKVKRILRKCTDEDFETTEADNQENESIKLKNNSVFPFEQLVLCNEDTYRVKVNVRAELLAECLKITGQDFGETSEDVFGENEYEYFYDFDRENTDRLLGLLASEGDVKEMLVKKFEGIDGCCTLRAFCDDYSIKYSFFSC